MRSVIAFTLLLTIPASSVSAQWTTSSSKDEMTGERSSYAHSAKTKSTKPMGFPYGNTEAWLGVGCDGSDEWAYIGFSNAPNLANTTTADGFNRFDARVRWDDNVQTMTFVQTWGEAFIRFRADSEAIAKMASASTLLLELHWYGEGTTYFQFSLRGSSAAIAKIRASCGR
jgi:hypothetical protein